MVKKSCHVPNWYRRFLNDCGRVPGGQPRVQRPPLRYSSFSLRSWLFKEKGKWLSYEGYRVPWQTILVYLRWLTYRTDCP